MRDNTYFYEVIIDGKTLYLYSKNNIYDNDKGSVMYEYFTNEKLYFKVIGANYDTIYNEDGEEHEVCKNIYGLFFPKEKLIFASDCLYKNQVKENIDKNQPSVTKRFNIRNLSHREFYHTIRFKLPFSKVYETSYKLFLKEQMYIKNREMQKDKIRDKKEKEKILKKEKQEKRMYYTIYSNKKSTK